MHFITHTSHGFKIPLPGVLGGLASFVEPEQHVTVPFGAGSLAARSVGHGPAVILVHDWSGLPDDMHPLAQALAAHNYQAVQFEEPSEDNALGGMAHLSELADEILVVAHAFGPVAAVIAHGAGATAAILALSRERFTRNAVLIGADATNDLAPGLPAGLGDVRSLLLHSRDDDVAPLHDALELAEAWPNCMLSRVERLGHQRLLFSPTIHTEVLRFLDSSTGAN